jgi:hypothetical protein
MESILKIFVDGRKNDGLDNVTTPPGTELQLLIGHVGSQDVLSTAFVQSLSFLKILDLHHCISCQSTTLLLSSMHLREQESDTLSFLFVFQTLKLRVSLVHSAWVAYSTSSKIY